MQNVYNLGVSFSIGKSTRLYQFNSWSFCSKVASAKKRLFLAFLFHKVISYKGRPIYLDSYYVQSVFCDINDITAPYYTKNLVSSILEEESYLYDEASFDYLVKDFITELEMFGFTVNYYSYDLSDLDHPLTQSISNIFKVTRSI